MKKNFPILLIFLCFCASVVAAPISPEAALSRIQSSTPGKRFTPNMHLVHTSQETSQPAYYVFSSGEGFVIAGADDMTEPVLGYSDNGTFDYDSIPDQLRSWLGQYAREVEYANVNVKYNLSRIIPASRPLRDAISPMIKTRWGQDEPYSLLCPSSIDNHKTGEIATAMAQLMRYWKWPAIHGNGIVYVIKNDYPRYHYALDTVKFDWDNMTNLYNSSSTEREKKL